MSIITEAKRIEAAKAELKVAIEEKGVTVGDGTIDTYPDKVREITAGGTDWLYYARKLNNTFGGVDFPQNTEFVARFKGATDYGYMFNNCRNIKSIKMITETPEAVIDMTAFCSIASNGNATLELVDFSEFNKQFSNVYNMFSYQYKLHTILGALDLTNSTNNNFMVRGTNKLENIEFVEGTIHLSISFSYSSLLTDASIQSIIDGLADLTGVDTQTIEFHSTIVAKLTETQLNQIANKNWTSK